ncbi:hypothetical protein IAQ61_001525 [Plenodomus lingam]|uniref:Similar to smr domain containing protein n=1 Tax=Leptosphaeria maculans (strain JN3 / isolate v23.1.3 / race Av1-4-5-6-7-8) TaxID=985895 RepID=E4ZYA8_LEPMJ|nr:similar to smr domain containing protein [Plenodomus lingam JN3]KAH9879706.1 hypothetical protein IAQ61_001525 [Plenodomus lingam]CBX96353.1 similar to smr domain containing protein [Plenodomus lingam JN3]
MDEHLRILEQEFCPPIDPSLISAIYSDYVGQADAIGSVRALLGPLKASAVTEQLTDFEPSGFGGSVQDSPGKGSADAESADTWATQTVSTDRSNLSSEQSTLSASGRSEGSSGGGYFKETEHFDVQTKEQLLAETFPNLRFDLITRILKKCNNDYDKATDELLNHVYFEDARATHSDDGPIAKGIDAFSEDHHVPQRGKKGKSKKQKKAPLANLDSVYMSESDKTPTNRWLNTQRDVEFITSRTDVPLHMASSLYHKHGASLSTTILEIVRRNIKAHNKEIEPDAALVQDAIVLNAGFPTLGLDYALALVRLTAPSTTNAHELAKALTQQPASETGGKGGIRLDLRYTPLNLSDPTSESTSQKLPTLAPTARPRDTASITRARSEAFQQASSAYRKGRSTPLMKAAAGYYAQEGRDLSANLRALSATEADTFVMSQSGPSYLDLHGVTVADATRIAKQRTQAWWNGLGEQRIPEWSGAGRRGGGEPFRIITGLGRHSEGGRGKLGPAVAKMLVNEGWKVVIEPGELLVTGLARRRY